MTIRPVMGGPEGGEPPKRGSASSDDSHARDSRHDAALEDAAPDDTAELIEPELDESVADAVLGEPTEDDDEAQPDRRLCNISDFASIYIRSRRSLENRARSFLTDPRDVEEVVQETFLRLVLAMPELEFEWQANAFCRRALTNLCIDRYRRDRRRPQLYDLDSGNVIDIAGAEYTDHPVLRAEDAAVVREALARLSPLHRAALVKREIEEKSLATIAAELDVPEESVKHLLFRARRALRRLLTGSAVDPDVDLTLGELAAVANQRLARATLRSAHAVVILVTAALVVAAGTRGLLPHRTVSSDGSSSQTPTSDRQRPVRPAATPRTVHKSTGARHKGRGALTPLAPQSSGSASQPSNPGQGTHSGTPTPTKPARHPSTPPSTTPPPRGGSGPFRSSQSAGAKGPYTVTVGGQTYTASAAMHTRPAGAQTASGSDLSVPNATNQGGSYTVSQQLVSTPAAEGPQVEQASVTVSLPVADSDGTAGQADYQLGDPDVVVDPMSDGSVRITMTGTAAAVGATPSSAPAAVDVSVAVSYLPDLTSLSQEQVTLSPLTGVGPFGSAQPAAFTSVFDAAARPLLALLSA